MGRRAVWDSGQFDGEVSRRRNIVLSYMRDGMTEENAVKCADQLIAAMGAWQEAIAARRLTTPTP